MKKILLLSFGLFWGQFIYGQKHIDTVTVTPTSVCAGSAISVRVAYTSAYNGGTDDAFSFLSDLNGNGYNSSNLINQHALSSTTFTFSYTIPLGTTAGNYRIFTKDTIALNQVDTFSNLFTVIAPATANAGSPQSVCQGGSVTLAGAIGGSATGATWSAPSGSFSNTTNLSSPYTPSITSGTVTLTLTTAGPCAAVTSTVVITVNATSTANAGSPQSVCQGGTVTLAGTKGGSATGSTWSAPSGSFSNTSLLNSTYTPSITTGTVTLTLTTSGPCAAATSTVVITVNPSATANAGSPQTLCAGGNVTLSGSIGGSATGSTWSAPSGSFSNASL
ncbi:MAG: hypothetical protein NTW54_00355, partial [Bacteroidetes bacterium]|nr:hypothetical protein [Bacteroidota bacterium]